MTITQLDTLGHVFLDDLKDVTFQDVSMTDGAVIQVLNEGHAILNHRYFADPSGEVHLDLRDLVRDRTGFSLPADGNGQEDYILQENSGIYLTVKQDSEQFGFYAFGFREGITDRITDIDYLRIPKDFLMLVSLPNQANFQNEDQFAYSTRMIDHIRTREMDEQYIGDGYIASFLFTMAELQPALHLPFQMEYAFQLTAQNRKKYLSPVYELVNGDFEQYAFLTDLGTFENIPMDGDLRAVPEFSFENARHPSGMVRVRDGREDIWEQNSGWLTAKAAEALTRLLSSTDIYRLEDGAWKRILIESPSVTVSKQASLRSVTFTWRHAETD